MATFNSQVLSAFGSEPFNLNYTLSGGNNTVELLAVGTHNSKQIEGIAFNSLDTTPVGTFAKLTISPGTSARVDKGYNGSQMAVIFKDGSTSLFTVVTGTSPTQQSLSAATFNSSWPELRRQVHLGYR